MRAARPGGDPARKLQFSLRDPEKEHALSISGQKPCRICQTGQRISTASFAFFAVGLLMAAMDPAETPLRQAVLSLCAVLSGLAAARFPIARLVAWRRSLRTKGQPSPAFRKQMP